MLGRGDFSEKRGFNRMGVDCQVSLCTSGGEVYSATARDLSATGLQVRMAQPLEMGMELHLTMTPSQSLVPPLEATVEVVRVAEVEGAYDIGLSIVEMKPAEFEE